MTYNVLVSDDLAEEGIAILREKVMVDVQTGLSEDELVATIENYDALLVRSGTQVTQRVIEAGKRLRFIGRAGAGVDNIDMTAATKQGIIVANAPEGNTLAATEHTMAMMLSLCRNTPQANASMQAGEWKRNKFIGIELNEKTLGIVGLGRIGREVAKRSASFDMKIIGYDPFITAEKAAAIGIQAMSLEELFKQADIITVHTPLIKETKHIVNAQSIATMKDGVRIINCARGGIIDEKALADAVKAGKVAGAAIDVFEQEPPKDSPLIGVAGIITTPHLGASTVEAQKNVSISVARQCLEVLDGGDAKYVVNAPIIPPDLHESIEPFAILAEKMGRFMIQIVEGRIAKLEMTYGGDLSGIGSSSKLITHMALKGILDPILRFPVNMVNAGVVAADRGISVSETVTGESEGYKNLLTIKATTDTSSLSISGSVLYKGGDRIVSVGGYTMDMVPEGAVIISRHLDKPGVIGRASTILGEKQINIAGMQVGRVRPGEEAIMVLNVDSDVPEDVMAAIRGMPGIYSAKFARI
ncbi:MAG TPA: phosphoglycerate dehydrogenase [Methanospirillum sp.]|nr:phosphoglycerate dehydrogenase [Methanospirillum sp.]